MSWKPWHVIGTDLNGRKCPVAEVSAPAHMNQAEALRYINHLGMVDTERRYLAVVSEIREVK
jgi:hypothetical protein